MQTKAAFSLLLGVASARAANPLASVLELMDELTAKITKDGEVEAKAYTEYVEWCDDTSKNTNYAIETAKNEKAELEASIGKLAGDIAVATDQIEDLAGSVSTSEKDVADATLIRQKEHSDFIANEKELMDAIDTLGRAIGILEKEMAKHPAALAQVPTNDVAKAMQALSALLDAAAFTTQDSATLTAFVQAQQADSADDMEVGAPAAATYKTQSGGILDVLEDLKEKAEGQLSDLRKAETNTKHNFDMLVQSLNDQTANNKKDKASQESSKAKASEAKAAAEGDLKMTIKDLESSEQQLATAHATCLQIAADHETTVTARKEELAVIAQAKKILSDTTTGAESQTYSFLQESSLRTKSDLAGSEVVAVLKKLAKREHSAELAQLASSVKAVLRLGGHGTGPFTKIKGLIRDMIAKLEKQLGAEATEKAYCDEQIAKTEAKKGELEEDIAKATSRIGKASARSIQLKDEVRVLEGELAALAKDQADMDMIRQESHADYAQAKADLELGLSGVRKALVVLRDYYNSGAAMLQQPAKPEIHSQAGGAGGSIIDILEVVESDFATNLAKEEMVEADAQSEYERITQENAVTKTTKDQSAKYKTQEAKSMDATVAEYTGDLDAANNEYAAVMEYYGKIKDRCIAKPETYEVRSARRAAEIQGLKDALAILNDETALVQRKKRGAFLATVMAPVA